MAVEEVAPRRRSRRGEGRRLARQAEALEGLADLVGYGAGQPTNAFAPQDVAVARYTGAARFVRADAQFDRNVLSTTSGGPQGSWTPCAKHPNVLFQHSRHGEDEDTVPDLAACNQTDARGNDPAGAYLKYIADPLPSDGRFNVRYSFHAFLTQGTGCYHRGLHSYPLVQVLGTSGTFRGWVGLEHQETGSGVMADNAYRVLRKVEQGFE